MKTLFCLQFALVAVTTGHTSARIDAAAPYVQSREGIIMRTLVPPPRLRQRSKKNKQYPNGDDSSTIKSVLEPKLFSIRGGGGGGVLGGGGRHFVRELDPKLAAKSLALAYVAQGAAFNLAPRYLNKVYGWEPDSDLAEYLTQNLGAAMLGTGIASCCLLFLPDKTTVLTAIGSLSLVWVLNYMQWLFWTKPLDKLEAPTSPFLLIAAVSCFSAYAGLANISWAKNYFNVIIPIFAAMALYNSIFASSSLKTWFPKQGIRIGDDEKRLCFMVRGFNFFLLAMELQNLLLLRGVDPAKAVAYASLVGLAYFLLSITKEICLVYRTPIPYIFWTVFYSLHIMAILVQGGDDGRLKPADTDIGVAGAPFSSATQ